MTTQTNGNPYVGPRTFEREQAHLFFGRDQEARDLLARVVSERLLLFYAQSGAGKSSLINTRLIPALEEEGFAVLPVGRVSGELPSGLSQVDNIFLVNLMFSLDQGGGDAARLVQLSLSEFLARLTSEDGAHWKYDESISLKTGSDPVAAGVVEPAVVQPFVLIVDQFEELITTHLDRWQEREAFLFQLNQALLDDPNLWVVLTLREDYVAALDPYVPLLFNRLRARFYMERMGIAAALQAVRRPAENGKRPFAAGVAEQLVDNLRQVHVPGLKTTIPGQYVEPVQLQVVCYQLWRNILDRLPGPITADDLQDAGDVDRALTQFYEETLAAVLADPPETVTERQVRAWFGEELITEAGTRGLVHQEQQVTGSLPNGIVSMLQKRFLVRAETRSGDTWIELIHDRMVEPIQRSNQGWFEQHRSPLALAANAWAAAGKSRQLLAKGQQLKLAQAQLSSHPDELSDLEQEYVKTSAERARRQTSRLMALMLTGSVVLLIALTSIAIRANSKAKVARSREMAAVAVTNLDTDPDLGVVLALQALTEVSTSEAENALHRALQAQRLIGSLRDPASSVNDVAYSSSCESQTGDSANQAAAGPCATVIATAEQDGSVILWNAETGDKLSTLTGHIGPALSVRFSPDGSQLAAGGAEGLILVWDVASQSKLVELAHSAAVTGLAFSPDGFSLVSVGDDGRAILWDLNTHQETGRFAFDVGSIFGVAFSPDGRKLAVGGGYAVPKQGDGVAQIWDLTTGALEWSLEGHHDTVTSIAFSPDGRRLATASWDETAKLWDASTGERLLDLVGHSNRVETLAFSPDGQHLATASADQTAKVWNTSTGREELTLVGSRTPLSSLSYSPTGNAVVTADKHGEARIWNVSNSQEQMTLTAGQSGVNGIAINPDGTRLATAGADNTVRVWDAINGKLITTLDRHFAPVRDVAFSPDGAMLATASDDRTAIIWDAATSKPLVTIAEHQAPVVGVAFSPDSRLLATASTDQTARLWDAATGAQRQVFSGHSDKVNSVAFSPDGTQVLTASADGTARLWDVATGLSLRTFGGNSGGLNSAVFLQGREGVQVATAGADQVVRLWDGATGQAIRMLTGHDDLVQAIAVNPAQSRLAAAGWDRTTRVWNPFTDELPLTLLGHTNKVTDLVFGPNGKTLITASEDDTVRWYVLDIRELIALARTRVSRALTKDECRRYLHGADCPKGQSRIDVPLTLVVESEPTITVATNETPALASPTITLPTVTPTSLLPSTPTPGKVPVPVAKVTSYDAPTLTWEWSDAGLMGETDWYFDLQFYQAAAESPYQASVVERSMAQRDGDTWMFDLPADKVQCGSSVVVQIAKREEGRFAGWLSQKSNRYPITPDCAQIEPTPVEAPPSQGLPASTATPALTTSSIGLSVNQRPIEVVRIGDGPRNIVLVGGKHAGYAPGSVQLARKLAEYFVDNPQFVPPDVTLHVVLNANPDSPKAPGRKSGRLNAHEVDLNRNWDCNWKQNALWGSQTVSGGSAPFSEPETQALRDFFVDLQPSAVVFWGAKASGGLVSPGGCTDKSLVSEDLARVYATSAGYDQGAFEAYAVTGDASNWLDGQGIPAIAVLLPDYADDDFDNNLKAIKAVLAAPPAQTQ